MSTLPGLITSFSDVDDLVDRLADDLHRILGSQVEATGAAHVALSGGSTPKKLFQHFVIDPNYRAMPWDRIHIWLVDERVVPLDDEKSNFRMLRETLLDHINIPDTHIHPMPVTAEGGDTQYENDLHALVPAQDGIPQFDALLLGMGGDGHTASLFPHTPALEERTRLVVFNDGQSIAAPRPRMTMTYPLINHAKNLIALVTGESKKTMLQQVADAFSDDTAYQKLPITGIHPTHAVLNWYLDDAANPMC